MGAARLIGALLLIALAPGCDSQTGEPAAPPTAALGRPILKLPSAASPSGPFTSPRAFLSSEPTLGLRPPGARRTAVGFFASYLRYLAGREPTRRLAWLSSQLRHQLRASIVRITPAERSSAPRILRIDLAPAGPPGSAIATATIAAGGAQYQLTATLEPRGRDWSVVALGG